ncbi:ATP-binding protein [Streptomyces sp. WELS2]|uniref:ATP-binding protein n=1 Tax=Streptomyces sp. WELS2 TaxID=2749435 RepID=UPI0015F0C8DC|nr:ATP-binding protein [Streptomyces sp. WELS2]
MSLLRQRRFPRSPRSVRAARAFVLETLTQWGYLDRHDDVLICVSELATNAVLHGVPPGREFCVGVVGGDSLIRIEVRDSGGGDPEIVRGPAEGCGGRGLHIASSLADGFGVTRQNPGEIVWTEFKCGLPAAPEVRNGSR